MFLLNKDEYNSFSLSGRNQIRFSARYRMQAADIRIGDRIICYITRASEWAGILEVKELPDTNVLEVKPIVWLEKDKLISLFSPNLWNGLTFTRSEGRDSTVWKRFFYGVKFRQFNDADGMFLEQQIRLQLSK